MLPGSEHFGALDLLWNPGSEIHHICNRSCIVRGFGVATEMKSSEAIELNIAKVEPCLICVILTVTEGLPFPGDL